MYKGGGVCSEMGVDDNKDGDGKWKMRAVDECCMFFLGGAHSMLQRGNQGTVLIFLSPVNCGMVAGCSC